VHGIALAVRAGASGRVLGHGSCCGHRRRRILGEFPGAARSDAESSGTAPGLHGFSPRSSTRQWLSAP
jgi:hypothetical protein